MVIQFKALGRSASMLKLLKSFCHRSRSPGYSPQFGSSHPTLKQHWVCLFVHRTQVTRPPRRRLKLQPRSFAVSVWGLGFRVYSLGGLGFRGSPACNLVESGRSTLKSKAAWHQSVCAPDTSVSRPPRRRLRLRPRRFAARFVLPWIQG